MATKATSMTVRSAGSTRTRGLRRLGQEDIEFRYESDDVAQLARDLADEIIRYIENGARIRPGDKMSVASSMLRFREQKSILRASALDLKSDEFLPFIDDLLVGWNAQRETCKAANSKYTATGLNDSVIVSPGVLTGEAIREAVRYPFTSPRSGWWMMGADYDGNPDGMRFVHVGDLLLNRPEVHSYLALEPGFCFTLCDKPKVWFEKNIANEVPI